MKSKVLSCVLALGLLAGMVPQKSEAAVIIAVVGAQDTHGEYSDIGESVLSHEALLGGAAISVALMVITGNPLWLVLDEKSDKSSLYAAMEERLPFLGDQPEVLNQISGKLYEEIKNVDSCEFAKGQIEIKLSPEDIQSIIEMSIVNEEQAQAIKTVLG